MKHHPPDGAVERARRLRHNMTDAERALWRLLREALPEWHFRRQSPIRHYLVDFVCHRAKLVVEVDGGQHSEHADATRTQAIEQEGYRVIRFWNHEVLGNPAGVLSVIASMLPEHHPTLRSRSRSNPPHRGEGL